MKRKIIQLAGKTLLVSIPVKWAKKYQLNKGEEIDVEEEGNHLIINSKKMISERSKSIDISDKSIMIKRILGALYKKGYDEMRIKYSNPEELEMAQEVIRNEFTGFEIVEHKNDLIIAKKISTVDPGEFDTILRRIFLVILSVAEDSLEDIKKNEKKWLETIALRDKDVNKLSDFCRRILSRQGYDTKNTHFIYFIVEQLEKIGDSYRDICRIYDKKLSNESLNVFKEINQYFRDFYELYYKFDLDKIVEFGKKRKQLLKKVEKLKDDRKIVFLLNKIIEEIFDMNGVLMAANL